MQYRKWDFFPGNEERYGIVTNVYNEPGGRQRCTTARNVTIECQAPELFNVLHVKGQRADAWLRNTQENFGDIIHSILELKQHVEGRDVYIVGAGVSAAKYASLLEEVKNGVIIAANNGIRYLRNPYRDNVYFCCMDWMGRGEWLEGLNIENMKAILCTVTNRSVWRSHGAHGRHWKESYWFANQCSFEANEFLAKNGINLPVLDAGFSVLYSVLHGLWLLRPRSIVFIGVDGCYIDGFQYPGVPVEWKPNHKWEVLRDINGKPVISDEVYRITRDLIVGMAYFLRTAGIRMINAAQMGTLGETLPVPATITSPDGKQFITDIRQDVFEQRRLADVIDELENSPVGAIDKKEVA